MLLLTHQTYHSAGKLQVEYDDKVYQ